MAFSFDIHEGIVKLIRIRLAVEIYYVAICIFHSTASETVLKLTTYDHMFIKYNLFLVNRIGAKLA